MRTLIAAAAVASITATGAGVGIGVAVAQPHHAAAATEGASTIRLVAHQQSEKSIDVGRKGFSAGDEEVSAAHLTRGGKTAGSFDGICLSTLVSKTRDRQICTQTFRLAKGEITSAGSVAASAGGPAPFDWAITGGTGSYAKARGFVHVIAGTKTVHMVVHLTH